jgi:hypothetical protein
MVFQHHKTLPTGSSQQLCSLKTAKFFTTPKEKEAHSKLRFPIAQIFKADSR